MNWDKYVDSKNAVLIFSNINRRYLTGFKSSFGYFLVTHTGSYLFVDGRYFEAAKNKVKNDIQVILISDIANQINEIIESFGIEKVYLETEISVSCLKNLESLIKCKVEASTQLNEDLYDARSVKSDFEIECIRKAQRIAESSLNEVLNIIKPGVTEKQVALELEYIMQKKGSEGISFETIAVSGKNSSLPHGVPTDKPICEGDFLTIDFGAVYGGYHSDMTRTFAIGYATDEMAHIYDIVLEAHLRSLATAKAGVSCKSVDLASRSYIEENGYSLCHSTGHGVGLEIHEYPSVSRLNEKLLIENQIITIEPGIYLPDKFGVRIEDMAVVRRNTAETLTNYEKTLIIL